MTWFGAGNLRLNSDEPVRLTSAHLNKVADGLEVAAIRGFDLSVAGLGYLPDWALNERERRAFLPLKDVVFRPGEGKGGSVKYQLAVGLRSAQEGKYRAKGVVVNYEVDGRPGTVFMELTFELKVYKDFGGEDHPDGLPTT